MDSLSSSCPSSLDHEALILNAQSKNADSEPAKAELVCLYRPLIRAWVQRVRRQQRLDEHTYRNLSDDMEQSGWLGFFKALASFDPTRGSTLGFFAKRFVENEIQHAIRSYRSYTARTITHESEEYEDGIELGRLAIKAGDVTLEQAVLSETRRGLQEFLQSLPERQRALLIAAGSSDASQAQLARARQVSRAAVNRDFRLIRQRAEAQLDSRHVF